MSEREAMMSSHRSFDGLLLSEYLNPPLRTVNFSDSPAVVLVSRFLRWAWNILPSPSAIAASASVSLEDDSTYASGANLVGAMMKEWSHMTPEERDAFPKIAGKAGEEEGEVEEWRAKIMGFYNHVFVDVMQFLPNVQHDVGHIHPPSYSHFTLDYMEDGPVDAPGLKGPVVKKWDTHVLLIPAVLGKDVEVRISRVVEGEEKTLETLKEGDKDWINEVWWVKKGTEVSFHVEGDYDRTIDGVAAVMVVGILCNEQPEGQGQEDKEEEGEYEIPAEQMAMMMAMRARMQEMRVDDVDLSGARMVTVGRPFEDEEYREPDVMEIHEDEVDEQELVEEKAE
jgi:hypothetical protein